MPNPLRTTATALALTLAATAPAAADDWAGAYAGVFAGLGYSAADPLLGVLAGYNMQSGSFVYGVEGDVFVTSLGDHEAFARVRAGFEVMDGVLAFATAGVGVFDFANPFPIALYSAGIGAEAAINDKFSIRADVEMHQVWGGPLFSGEPFAKLGGVWRF